MFVFNWPRTVCNVSRQRVSRQYWWVNWYLHFNPRHNWGFFSSDKCCTDTDPWMSMQTCEPNALLINWVCYNCIFMEPGYLPRLSKTDKTSSSEARWAPISGFCLSGGSSRLCMTTPSIDTHYVIPISHAGEVGYDSKIRDRIIYIHPDGTGLVGNTWWQTVKKPESSRSYKDIFLAIALLVSGLVLFLCGMILSK